MTFARVVNAHTAGAYVDDDGHVVFWANEADDDEDPVAFRMTRTDAGAYGHALQRLGKLRGDELPEDIIRRLEAERDKLSLAIEVLKTGAPTT